VLDLLEVLPELTSQFEIVIVDDASVDATIEVADELAGYYPQVKALRHATSQGRLAAITTGLQQSTGEIVLLHDPGCTVASDEICRLWRAIDAHEVVLGLPSQPYEWRWNRRMPVGPEDRGGFLMFHRRVSEPIRSHLVQSGQLRQYLASQKMVWHELRLRDRALQPIPQPHKGMAAGRPRGLAGVWSASAQSNHQQVTSAPRRPNYLHRLREFALGE
jgi:glycosyltransferase involved in cell wall biosynthesis